MKKFGDIVICLWDNIANSLSHIFHLLVKDKNACAKVNRIWGKLSKVGIRRWITNKNNRKKYLNDKKMYCQRNRRKNFEFKSENEYPILNEWNTNNGGGINSNGYFWQDLWAAKAIAEKMPERHFDIGSRVDGFIAHLMVLNIPITLIDIRPMDAELSGVNFVQADATQLNGIEDNSIESLSALCSLEHFGLGRYGDPIDPEACFKAFKSIQRVVKPGGYIYLSLVVGEDGVCFNAHRVFNPYTVVQEFSECSLEEFSVWDSSYNPALRKGCDLQEYQNMDPREPMGLFCFKKNG